MYPCFIPNVAVVPTVSLPAVGAAAAPATPSVLVNGDFSAGNLRQGWTALYPGSAAIVGWHIVAPIDYVSSAYWEADGASRSVDLDGTPGPGAIEQRFATTPGDTYIVRFALGANTEGPPRMKRVRVTVADVERTFFIDMTGRRNTAMRFERMSFTFVAPAHAATLQFASLSRVGNWNGAVIANVFVSDQTAGTSGETAFTSRDYNADRSIVYRI